MTMKYKTYSSEIWQHIEKNIELVLKQQLNPVAAFDADGTLWDTDLGENFFQYLIDQKLVELPKNPWTYYQNLKTKNNDPREAYLWLAQICQGNDLTTIHNWAKKAVEDKMSIPIFDEQKRLVEFLLNKNIQIYIVTASVKWAVEPGAELLGLSKDNVIGVETEVIENKITEKQKGIITYKQGKVDALLQKTKDIYPFFASGNTMGDFNLLCSATHVSLAVSAASRDDKLFRTEDDLQNEARAKNWLHHRFV